MRCKVDKWEKSKSKEQFSVFAFFSVCLILILRQPRKVSGGFCHGSFWHSLIYFTFTTIPSSQSVFEKERWVASKGGPLFIWRTGANWRALLYVITAIFQRSLDRKPYKNYFRGNVRYRQSKIRQLFDVFFKVYCRPHAYSENKIWIIFGFGNEFYEAFYEMLESG